MSDALLDSKTAPHLVLGIRSDSSSSDAIVAFARSAKRIKTDINAPFSIEDLTSALSEIETLDRVKQFGLKYSIPANPLVYDFNSSFLHMGEILSPNHDLANVPVSDIAKDEKHNAGRTFLAAAIQVLFQWDWKQSAKHALTCLRLSVIEDERDEALNVLAASLAMRGDGTKALDALKKAVEGQWNLALQTNLALLATKENPDLAIIHMSHLVDGATSETEKLKACRMAISLWATTQTELTGSDDQDDFEPLPRELLNAMYGFIVSPEINEENFFELAQFIARVDADTFLASQSVEKSIHRDSPSAKIVKLRAEGLFAFWNGLIQIGGKIDSTRPWIAEKVDDLVQQVASVINNSENSDDQSNFSFNMSFKFLEDGLDCSSRARIIFRASFVVSAIQNWLGEDATPSTKFITWLSEAKKATELNAHKMAEDQKDLCLSFIAHAGTILAAKYHDSYLETSTKVNHLARQLSQRTTGIFNTRKTENRRIAIAITETCDQFIPDLNSVSRLIGDENIKNAVKQMLVNLKLSKSSVSKYL